MTQSARLESLEMFRTKEATFLLATDVAARGLDISGVQVWWWWWCVCVCVHVCLCARACVCMCVCVYGGVVCEAVRKKAYVTLVFESMPHCHIGVCVSVCVCARVYMCWRVRM